MLWLRFLGRLLLVLIGLVLLLGMGGWFWLRGATLPQHAGRLALKGLSAPVEMNRTAEGVLHIKAQTDADAFFALGVAHAQDRLWQMEFQRRVGAGRLSEVVGKATLTQDRFLRTWGFYRAAEQAYVGLSPYALSAVDAYVAGINAYLSTNPPLPLEFRLLGFRPEPWKPADVLVWAKMMSYDLSGNWRSELQRLQWAAKGMAPERMSRLKPPYPTDAPTALQAEDLQLPPPTRPDGESARSLLTLAARLPQALHLPGEQMARASNNWVIGPSRTVSGKPLLANDPHLGLGAPSVWYLVHMEAPTYKAIGTSFPGLPAVVIGRNERIGWGVTTVGADVQDLYIMEEVAGGYRYKGQVEPWRIRTEVIKVKGEPDVTLQVRESRYGPVINDVVNNPGARPLSLRWTSLDDTDRTMEAFLGIARAQNWEQFKAALALYNAPSQNFVYADVDGNIGYMAPARFPIRKPGHSGLMPVPGDGNWDWQGYLPQDQWPQVYNPKEGFIVTANNKVTAPGYPHTISLEWEEPYRAQRIRELILAKDKLSIDDMVSMQQDITSLLFREFKPVLEVLNPLSENARQWKARLLAWDGVMRAEQVEPTVFQTWYTELSRLPSKEVGQDFWEQPRYLLAAMRQGDPACQTADTQTCLDYAALALDKALDRFGNNPPRWGEVHRATFPHAILTNVSPLNRLSDRAVPHGGDRYTLNRASYDPANFRMTVGSSYRHILDFADLERSLFIIPMGQSGGLLSPAYDNLLQKWASGQYLPMRMGETGFRTRQTLEPQR
ncbi:penicillin acylase family protein [Meiothermus hypogaeus]|uniref:Penicillin acylase n=2 Tax=Meiothermus hypogaeus TaxID=884155 RepID=A0A511R0V1_9DEIN|nr:penicillin acylase family protein [Meiothermus hypogaeus]RIH78743.1 Acyl-homoserine lactone acylase QuiP [Meiothermus hypogaeus]GEM83228.1 penicillin acylase [Meiothermus hypogaeus NBRC 106114]